MILFILSVALPVWCMVDASIRPAGAWQRSGRSKQAWVALQALAVLLAICGFLIIFATAAAVALALGYALAVRPALRVTERAP